MKFTESSLEEAIIQLFNNNKIDCMLGEKINKAPKDILIYEDLENFLKKNYLTQTFSDTEIKNLIKDLTSRPASDLFETNKSIIKNISDGYFIKRDDRKKKDILINLIDFKNPENNTFKLVNQLEVIGYEKRIPDCVLFVNGLPLVVFEFKSAIKENCTIHDAYIQLSVRYKRDIPEIFKYNAFCVISDGVNNKIGSIFSKYEHFYSWRRSSEHDQKDSEGIDTLFSLINGAFDKKIFCKIIENFIYFSDVSKNDEKIICRYPQFYAALKLFKNILSHKKPSGDGKGGTYFGATGCGKSFTMLFLVRLLMRSLDLSSPTIILITDRTDLDDQLSDLFESSKIFIGDDTVLSVSSRDELRNKLKDRKSGGVFLTTIQKFNEDTELLTERNNIVCISDEAHRTQINLDQNIQITEEGVIKKYGFAKHLHNSLPNATYVGFTGTPIEKTIDVFGDVIDAYTMRESVEDQITVKIVYEGRAAKVLLDKQKLEKIEEYYESCADEGASEYAIEESKKSTTKMNLILGDQDRLKILAEDFVSHYEKRCNDNSSILGKVIFVSSSRSIAYDFYKYVTSLRPEWLDIKKPINSSNNEDEAQPIERIKMVMTRDKDDPEELWSLLGDKKYRKNLDKQFKKTNSNFKIAIVVDMWLTGFDVPSLDTIYIDKPIKRHNLIQAISRVNRNYPGKSKGLIVDYIGIKKQMNLALAQFSKTDQKNVEEIEQSITILKNNLKILNGMFENFDKSKYYNGSSLEKLNCLKLASEHAQLTSKIEKEFMKIVKELKYAYDICSGTDEIDQNIRDQVYFYISIRSIIHKLTKQDAPDAAKMNDKVREMVEEAIKSDGIEEVFKIGEEKSSIDLFDDSHLEIINKIKLPNTKFKLLQSLMTKKIDEFKKVNKVQSINFGKKLEKLVEKYNDRKEQDVLHSEVINEFSQQIIDLYEEINNERKAFSKYGIDIEEKAFFDILLSISKKYQFDFPEDKMIELAKEVKKLVIEKSKYVDWINRNEIKAELKADLVILLSKFDYPPITHDETYKEIFEQASNYNKFSQQTVN